MNFDTESPINTNRVPNQRCYKFVVWCLTLLGLACETGTTLVQTIKNMNRASKTTAIVVNLYFLYYLYLIVIFAIKVEKFSAIVYLIQHAFKVLASIFVVDYCLFQRNLVLECTKTLERLQKVTSRSLPLKNLSLLNLAAVISGFLILLLTAFGWTFYFYNDLRLITHLKMHFHGDRFFRDHVYVTYTLMALDITLYLYVIVLNLALQILLAFTCNGVRLHVNALADNLHNCNVLTFARHHTQLLEVVQDLDSTFKWILLIWIFDWIKTVCFNLSLLFAMQGNADISYIGYTEIFLAFMVFQTALPLFNIGVLMLTISMLSDCNSTLNSATLKTLDHLRQEPYSVYKYLEHTYTRGKISSGQLNLTFLNCFALDKGFVTSVFGGAISYLVFVLSIAPNNTKIDSSCNCTGLNMSNATY